MLFGASSVFSCRWEIRGGGFGRMLSIGLSGKVSMSRNPCLMGDVVGLVGVRLTVGSLSCELVIGSK
jgi:hypothetical protein